MKSSWDNLIQQNSLIQTRFNNHEQCFAFWSWSNFFPPSRIKTCQALRVASGCFSLFNTSVSLHCFWVLSVFITYDCVSYVCELRQLETSSTLMISGTFCTYLAVLTTTDSLWCLLLFHLNETYALKSSSSFLILNTKYLVTFKKLVIFVSLLFSSRAKITVCFSISFLKWGAANVNVLNMSERWKRECWNVSQTV